MIHQTNDVRVARKTSFQVRGVCFLLWLLFLIALAAGYWNWTQGIIDIVLFKQAISKFTLSFGFRVDTLSTTMFAMITLLGAIIGQYSVSYLAQEKRQEYFFRYLLLAIVATSLLVTSNNLVLFFISWLGASLSLHKLLVYYDDRAPAVTAARKKFIISRIGDVALLLAIFLTYQTFNTFEFQELFEKAKLVIDGSEQSRFIGLIGFLFALGAMTKSAQFPFHFWLPETMESPTPVSALMHAGIINAGGFLVIRLSPILEHADATHILLAGVGSFTAVFAALVMITQNHLKGKLAYSTISQMGMMLFACGLGAYSLALFHIVAHSFYKAYTFLSTGLQIEESKKLEFPKIQPSFSFLGTVTILGLFLLLIGLAHKGGVYLSYYTYAAVICLGVIQSLGSVTIREALSLIASKTGLAIAASVALFMFFEYNLSIYLSELVPNIHSKLNWYSPDALICLFSYLVFAFGLWLSSFLAKSRGVIMARIYCYFWNGGYFSTYSTVFLERLFGKSQLQKQPLNPISTTEHANA